MNSGEYLKQLNSYGTTPDFKTSITQMYDKPVLRNLAEESGQLESQYLPSVFNPLATMGTEASDMSPAAKLAAIGASLGRLGGRVNTNRSIQDFYGNQISNLANTASQQWNNEKTNLWDLYRAQYQREQDDFNRRMQEQQMAMSARNAAAANAGMTDWKSLLQSRNPISSQPVARPTHDASSYITQRPLSSLHSPSSYIAQRPSVLPRGRG
jgi:hypothetical protein